ncbi:MAG: hypothetical protein IJX78_07950 [Bacilli bacterium]|nr:hypothetical protein [Bacilli bacterium]
MKNYKIAEKTIQIKFIDEGKHQYFRNFETEELASYQIIFEMINHLEPLTGLQEDENGLKYKIVDEKKLVDIRNDKGIVVIRCEIDKTKTTVYFIEGFTEIAKYEHILSYMCFTEVVADEGVISLHATAVTFKDKAIIVDNNNLTKLFIEQWIKMLNEENLISDDKLFIKLKNNQIVVYANPWNGSGNVASDYEGTLKTIVLLEKGLTEKIIELDGTEKMDVMVKKLGIMNETISNKKLFNFCVDLCDKVDIYKYQGKMKDLKNIFNKIYFN